jgi:hypothetical protein
MKGHMLRLRSAGATLALITLCAASAAAQVYNPQRVIYQVDARTIAATGGIATLTLTPTRSYVAITCNDTDGCAVTMGESGIPDGMPVTIVNVTANYVTLTPSAGVLEAPCPMQLQQYESFNIIYRTDRWVAIGADLTCRTITTLTNAQIIALPTTPITIVAAQGTNKSIKPIGVSLYLKSGSGAYGTVNTTYADLSLRANGSYYINYPISVNDSTTTPVLSQLTAFLVNTHETVINASPVPLSAIPVAGAGGYVIQDSQTSGGILATDLRNKSLDLYMDNNGSGVLSGGNAANTLRVIVYWVREDIS